ncbi:hypothetical protein F4778DRAFT_605957 [Xylariomycetidae sp. FL2044]|nr:hypothetical protein F4778DRAFT_605957 [Xylariomycetidae sp. FL2044]
MSDESPPPAAGGLSQAIEAISVTFLCLASIGLGFRLWARVGNFRTSSRGRCADDILLVFGLLLLLSSCVLTVLACRYGMGRAEAELDPSFQIRATEFTVYEQILFPFSAACVQSAVAVTLLPFFQERRFFYPLWTSILLTWITAISTVPITLANCDPVGALWNSELGYCYGEGRIVAMGYVVACVHVLLDWMYIIAAVTIYCSSHKVAWNYVLAGGWGIVAGVAAVMRIPYLGQLPASHAYLSNFGHVALWSNIEVSCGILALVFPSLVDTVSGFRTRLITTKKNTKTRMQSIRIRSARWSMLVPPGEGRTEAFAVGGDAWDPLEEEIQRKKHMVEVITEVDPEDVEAQGQSQSRRRCEFPRESRVPPMDTDKNEDIDLTVAMVGSSAWH